MKPNFKTLTLFFSLTIFLIGDLWAAPPNNTRCTAELLDVGSSCFTKPGTLYQATATNPGGCGSQKDVWYKFIVPSFGVTITVTRTNTGSTNLTNTNTFVELFNTTDCSVNGTQNGTCNNINSASTYSNLTPGTIYYFRVYTTVGTPNINATFDICLSAPASSRMNEVFKQTVLSGAGVLNYPWEIAYGRDNNLWITEARGYKVYKMDPNTGVKTTVLDLSTGSTWLPAPSDSLNAVSTSTWTGGIGWPQGGFAGLVLHPKFLDGSGTADFVYVSYVHRYVGGSTPTGVVFRNKIVRFTYNTGTGKLGNPLVLCDTLPGSSDHNSQRMIIASVTPGGPKYLFYGSGDMGAGQFGNRDRPNRAQIPASYEGKILRFNLDTVGGVPKIPTDNPYSSTSAVWAIGMRNNQGFAYDSALNILYGSAHGPYSDDEINIIQPFKNYGHPLVIGYADGNYNGTMSQPLNTSITAGAPYTDNTGISACPPIGNETTRMGEVNAAGNGPYKGPLFSAYPTPQATIANTWKNNTGNANWYSEAWSGLDLYTSTTIPGWNKSLVAAGLKWGRLIRLPLGPTGTTTLPSNLDSANTADTITYFQSTNRYRDLAFSNDGKDIFLVMDNSSATSGPGVGNPIVPGCQGCVVKYTFLGYADAGGLSSIPKTVPVTSGSPNICNTGTPVTIDASNNFLWVPITGPDGNIMAEINAMGQNLGLITSSFYRNTNSVRVNGALHYLDRNITITPAVTSFATPVKVRLYISKAEFDALKADPLGGVLNINQLKVLKNNDACGSSIASVPILLTPTNTSAPDLAQGTDGYVLQVNVSGFSTFYFAANNSTLASHQFSFTGMLQNNSATLLKWKTENEINASYFVLERGDDGQNFASIATIAANANTSTENNYSYTDNDVISVLSQNVYYRLKLVYTDGKYKYSNIINIALPGTKGIITVTPNPAHNELKATLVSPEADNAFWQIIDNSGRVVLSNTAVLQKGNNVLSINLNKLTAGSYYLKISGTSFEDGVKFQKL